MTPRKITISLSFLVAAGLLSACATPPDTVATRAWQADSQIAALDEECRYDVLSSSAADDFRLLYGSDITLDERLMACPDAQLTAFGQNSSGEEAGKFGGSSSSGGGSDFEVE